MPFSQDMAEGIEYLLNTSNEPAMISTIPGLDKEFEAPRILTALHSEQTADGPCRVAVRSWPFRGFQQRRRARIFMSAVRGPGVLWFALHHSKLKRF
jgi:hypothetical protein